jgi:uncharacterized membrane protein YphA (DoxX/SURF4 family)
VVLFNLVPQPETQGNMKIFNEGLAASGYLMQLVKITELVCGLAFLTGFFVPLAAVVLFPVSVNIIFVNVILAPEALPMGLILLAGNLFIAFTCRKHYTGLLQVR